MKYQWKIAPANPLLAGQISRACGVAPLLAQCLINRGHTDPSHICEFLQPRLKNLGDPFALPNMAAAVKRLWLARERQETLVVFGDYDVDGVSSTALLVEVLSRLGWQVCHYLPHRMDEGYGLSRDAAENCLHQHAATLFLAVDCGTTAVVPIGWLRAQGVDVIVLDHHQPEGELPPATAIVNPQLEEGRHTEYCSAGLAFKLAHALVKHGRAHGGAEFAAFDLRPLLDLVALGTIADLVPLVRENRILAATGLERLNQTRRPGLLALKTVAQVAGEIGAYEVGFQLGPRLNAAGRLETANQALQLLLADSLERALPLAKSLDACNRERQAIERKVAAELAESLRATFNPREDYVIVAGCAEWHIGVVGIVASRILHEFHRPTIVLGGDGHTWRGSGRSIEGFDLAAALRECDALLARHGGHSMAAGVALDPRNLDAFRARLNALAKRELSEAQLQPALTLDAELPLAAVTPGLVAELDRLRPFGQQNSTPQLVIRNLTHARAPRRMGAEQRHVKLQVTDGSQTLDALWWNAAELSWPTGRFALACVLQQNEYRGATSLQLKVLDWRPEA